MINLTDRAVLITGASRGIGAACAELFARAGAHVGLGYRSREDKARAVQARIEELGRRAILLQGNAADYSTAKAHVEQMVDVLGQLDILVNNAGIWTSLEIGSGQEDEWDQTMEINLKSVFNYTDATVPFMKQAGSGSIINVSSTAGQRGEAFHSHYAAAKGGIIAYTKSLAVELAPAIRVNAVAPGWVDTEMTDEVFSVKDFREQIQKGIPLDRIPTADDIAGPILFLASDLARHITGEILNVNGGAVLCG